MQTELTLYIKKIFLLTVILCGFYILYTLSSIVLMLVISGFLTILINPLADKWEKHHIPAWMTVIGVYIVIFLLGSIVIGTLIPIIINYVTDTASVVINWVNSAQSVYITQGITGFHFHPYIEKVILLILGENNIEHTLDIIKQNAGNIQSMLTTQISSLTSGGISIVSAVWGAVASWWLVAITTFLMVLERKAIGSFILSLAPARAQTYLEWHYRSVQQVCNAWIKATLILSVSIFVVTYIGLYILEFFVGGVFIEDFVLEKKFTLALIGGIMEFIPYIGPLLALIPAVIIGLGISWKVAIFITLLYLIIQRIENDALVPYVMSKALNLSPFLVFVVMMMGATLGGILGIILAVPIAWVARVIYGEYQKKRTPHITHTSPEQKEKKPLIKKPIVPVKSQKKLTTEK